MGRFDLGVFVDAHYLLDAAPRERTAAKLIRRIEIAAEERCMSLGIADRLVVADCADNAARALAEDFGAEGFVIRHVPERAAPSRGQVLTAEITEAAGAREELRTVAVVAPEHVPLSVADALHRSGRALIGCLLGAPRDCGVLDGVVALPLDGAPLRSVVNEAVAALRAAGRIDVRIPEVENAVRRARPGFTAAAYGTTTKRLLQTISGAAFRFVEPDRVLILPQNGSPPSAAVGNGVAPEPATASFTALKEAMVTAAGGLPTIPAIDEEAVVEALRSVLALAAEQSQLRAAAMGPGLTIQMVCAGLAVVAADYRTVGSKPLELCRLAVEGTSWQVSRNPQKPEDIRLRLTNGHAVQPA